MISLCESPALDGSYPRARARARRGMASHSSLRAMSPASTATAPFFSEVCFAAASAPLSRAHPPASRPVFRSSVRERYCSSPWHWTLREKRRTTWTKAGAFLLAFFLFFTAAAPFFPRLRPVVEFFHRRFFFSTSNSRKGTGASACPCLSTTEPLLSMCSKR